MGLRFDLRDKFPQTQTKYLILDFSASFLVEGHDISLECKCPATEQCEIPARALRNTSKPETPKKDMCLHLDVVKLNSKNAKKSTACDTRQMGCTKHNDWIKYSRAQLKLSTDCSRESDHQGRSTRKRGEFRVGGRMEHLKLGSGS